MTLQSFYRSRQWESLLRTLKLERVNEDGELICAHCGKPITRAYDCIGHHVIELTEQNVGDASVSLNPDNIMLIHHRCHNEIHNRFGYAAKKVYLVYGAPCSGKTSYVKENMRQGDLIVDIDSIWECISCCDRYVKPKVLKSIVFRMRDELYDMIRMRAGKWSTAWVIGGYPLTHERERLLDMLDAEPIFIDTSYDECIARLEKSNDRDKSQWKIFIDDWFEKFSPDSPTLLNSNTLWGL